MSSDSGGIASVANDSHGTSDSERDRRAGIGAT